MKNEPINRELDAWIAEHVFGYRWVHFGYCDKEGLPKIGPSETIYLIEPQRVERDQTCTPFPRDKVDSWLRKGPDSYPEYSTDPAAALEVLKRCAKRCEFAVEILGSSDGSEWIIEHANRLSTAHIKVSAPTLELAIARFAMELFK